LAYVFIHLLPELASGGRTISEAVNMHRYLPTAMTESLLFLVTLVGVVIPYALNVISQQHPASRRWTGSARLATFALINYLYAYSLPSLLTTGISYGVLFTVAISTHILLAERTLAREHPTAFRRRFRWIGCTALVVGSVQAAALHPVSDLTLALATAFVGGGLLISVFRQELPDTDHSRLGWFGTGLLGMTTLLLVATSQNALAH
jgi:zinc transporter ZupT